jgi:prepilin-type N-terminal cleavage/methylation domain-containing protein
MPSDFVSPDIPAACVRARSCACGASAGPRRERPDAAFTLVELLVVMAIILVIIGSAVPIVRGVLGGSAISNGVESISGYLTNARIQAMSQNTYVVVGFYQAAGSDDLQMDAVKSLSGTFTPSNFPPSSPTSTALGSYRPLGPIVHLPNITLTSFSNLVQTFKTELNAAGIAPYPANQNSGSDPSMIVIPDTPAKPSGASNNMAFQVGSTTTSTTFNWYVIVFTPQGEALYFPESASSITYSASTASVIPYYGELFMGITTSKGGTALANDQTAAAITIDGGSGSVNVHRL